MEYYEITAADVGKNFLEAFGTVWPMHDVMGPILRIDVGKRLFKRGDVLQVENQEQAKQR